VFGNFTSFGATPMLRRPTHTRNGWPAGKTCPSFGQPDVQVGIVRRRCRPGHRGAGEQQHRRGGNEGMWMRLSIDSLPVRSLVTRDAQAAPSGHRNRDLLGEHRRVVRPVVVVAEEHLQRVLAGGSSMRASVSPAPKCRWFRSDGICPSVFSSVSISRW